MIVSFTSKWGTRRGGFALVARLAMASCDECLLVHAERA